MERRKYKELKEPCKSLIEKNICLGCTGLGEEDWKEPKKCSGIPKAEDSIRQIFLNLGVERNEHSRTNKRYR
nr:MAG TPA: hypothetical protein [Caudoviricetes sp.]